MKICFQRIATAGAACLSLALAASAVAAQDRPPPPGPGSRGAAPRPPGPSGQIGADRPARFADMHKRREQRLHDLLQIKPDQEAAYRTLLTALEQDRPQQGGPGGGPGRLRPQSAGGERLTTPERLDRMAQRIAERQQRAQRTAAAVRSFYAVLSPEQRKAFDELPVMRIGDRQGRGRHGSGRMMRGGFRGLPPGPLR